MNRRGLVVLACFIGFSVLALLARQWLRPEASAYAGQCISRLDGTLANTCDRPVIAALCRDMAGGQRPDDPCVLQTLAPGEALTATLHSNATGQAYTMACNAPFEPRWKPSNSNSSLFRQACRKPF